MARLILAVGLFAAVVIAAEPRSAAQRPTPTPGPVFLAPPWLDYGTPEPRELPRALPRAGS